MRFLRHRISTPHAAEAPSRRLEIVQRLRSEEHATRDELVEHLFFSLSTVDLAFDAHGVAEELAHLFDVDYCHLTILDLEHRVVTNGEFAANSAISSISTDSHWAHFHDDLRAGYLVVVGGDDDQATQDLLRSRGMRSYAGVPVISRGHLSAVVGLATHGSSRSWTEEEIRLLRQLSIALGIAVENSRLNVAVKQKLRETEALYAVTRALLSPLPLAQLLPEILQTLYREFSLSTTAVALWDEEQQGLVISAAHGYPPHALDAFPVFPLGTGVIGTVMQTKRAVNIADISEAPEYVAAAPNIRSEMCVPLVVRGTGANETIGVLNAESQQPGAFSEHDLQLFESIAAQLALVIRHHQLLGERVQMINQLESSIREFAKSLGHTIEKRDGTTHGHVERTEALARRIAERLGLSEKTKENLFYGCALHDVGKIGIPDSILLKPGPLDEGEWRVMKTHSTIGADIVRPIRRLQEIAPIILYHQEKVDGTGYPAGLRGEEIPIESRIIGVIDAYDAMVSQRPYNVPKTHEDALAELRRCSGTQFDATIVEAFIEVIDADIRARRV